MEKITEFMVDTIIEIVIFVLIITAGYLIYNHYYNNNTLQIRKSKRM